MSLDTVRIVLVRPQGAANVGAAARAMKNMGLADLLLVGARPARTFWSRAMAVHAADVLDRVRVTDTLPEAVADCGLVVGTTARQGGYRTAAEPLRTVAPRLVAAAAGNRVALVFGPEDHGLSTADLMHCQQLLTVPANPAYPSLNLAQAVMVCCYELAMAAAEPVAAAVTWAAADRLEQMFAHLQRAFLAIGFLHPENPDHIMLALRQLLGRTQLDEREVRIFMALARQIEWSARRSAGAPPPATAPAAR